MDAPIRRQHHAPVRMLTHIKQLDDAFGHFLAREICDCGACCIIGLCVPPGGRGVWLDGLDATAMKAFWSDLMSSHRASWSATKTNCACAVIAALRAGGADNYIDWVDEIVFDIFNTAFYATLTPESAYRYAVLLQGKLRNANLMP